MALTNYTTLQTAIADLLNRSDLTAAIQDFITLAEIDIKARLRKKTTRNAAFSLNSAAVALPADCEELRSIRLNSALHRLPIEIVTPEALADYRQIWRDTAGVPRWGSVVDGTLLLVPTPDSAYTSEIIYYRSLTSLSGGAPTNDVMPSAADIYLYGAALQAAPYLEHDERIPTWRSFYDAAIDRENLARERAELGGNPRASRLPTVFG